MNAPLAPDLLETLRQFDTCTLANAIETFALRLRNEGYTDPSIRCIFPRLTPMVGYAVPITVRCSGPPTDGSAHLDRTDWWNYILTIPAPRVVVLQEIDEDSGNGAYLGAVHSHILMALNCVGAVTNGAVRDIPTMEKTGFHFFARNIAVSHSYVHLVSIDRAVEVGGLKINPGDLLHGDGHGILSVPKEIAGEIPARAAQLKAKDQALIALCRSRDFTLEKIRQAVNQS